MLTNYPSMVYGHLSLKECWGQGPGASVPSTHYSRLKLNDYVVEFFFIVQWRNLSVWGFGILCSDHFRVSSNMLAYSGHLSVYYCSLGLAIYWLSFLFVLYLVPVGLFPCVSVRLCCSCYLWWFCGNSPGFIVALCSSSVFKLPGVHCSLLVSCAILPLV